MYFALVALVLRHFGMDYNNRSKLRKPFYYFSKDLTKTHLGTWVLESASKDATGSIQFTAPNRGIDTQSVPVTDSLAHWTIDPSYELTTDSKNLFLNSAGRLAPAFGKPKARFICQHTPLEFDAPPPQPQGKFL